MKRRWGWLFATALLTMVGAMWMGQRTGTGLYIGSETIGMIIATAIAFVAFVRASRSKLFAVGVLLCSMPALFAILYILGELGEVFASRGAAGLLTIASAVATPIVAVSILVRPLPPPPADDPIARAKIVD